MNCPICRRPMPPRLRDSRPRVTCSRPCAIILRSWALWMICPHHSYLRARRRRDRVEREVDAAVVDRLTCGQHVDSARSERLEATRILSRWGRSAAFIAMQLHVSKRSVERYRRDLLLLEGV